VQPITTKGQRAQEIHYIAMELVDGETLREFLEARHRLSRRIEVLAQIAEGLGKAHTAGIVHRDLKPDNVMISSEGYAKVVDFGLAKLVEPARGWNPLGADSPTMRALTQQGELIGTAGYMSPEQITGKAVDQRSDIFSFGCIVYETVTGRKPFEGDSFVDTLHEVLHATPKPIENAELQRIVNKCLVKDRENRYQSIRDVAIDLRAVAHDIDAPVAASRKRGPIAMWPAIAAIIAIATGFGIWRIGSRHVASAAGTQRASLQRVTSHGRVGHLATSSDGRFVAYSASDDKGQSVWLAQTATGSAVNVIPTSEKAHYAGLALSSDSNYLLSTYYDGTVYGAVASTPLLGGAPTKIIGDADTVASMSPDGKEIAVTRDVLERGESRVLVASRDGSNERVVATFPLPQRANSPAWSPDGTRIAVAHNHSIYMIDPLKAAKTSVKLADWNTTIRDIAWRGNDTLLMSAVDDRSAGHFQLFDVDLGSGRVRNLTDDFDDYAEPRLSGNSIAAIQAKRQATLWSLASNGATEQITRGLGSSDGLAGVTWTKDQRIVYSSSAAGPIDLWIANADGSSARQLTHDDALEFDPEVASDGQSIVYAARSRGEWALWKMSIDGAQTKQLATAPAIYDFALTPDSKRIVFASCSDAKGCALVSTSIDGGATTPIANTGVFLKQLAITPDGRTIVYTALDDKALKLFSVPIGGGTPTRLSAERASDAAIAPDGKSIASSYQMGEKGAKLAVFPVGGAAPRVFDLDGLTYRWSSDGKRIIYMKYDGKVENLYEQPTAGGESKQLTKFTEGHIANFESAADGRIVLTHYVETRDVVLLK
jgi:serine/threonine protein kinase